MASVVNTNINSLYAQDSISRAGRSTSTAMQRLSTGSKINSAKDDAAGLSISDRMTSQVRGLNMAIKNANDGISLMSTAEGAMDEVTNMLQRIRELAVQSINGTNTAADRSNIDAEVQQLKSEIDRVAKTTQFNNINLLDGSFSNKTLQIGDKAATTMKVSVASVKTQDLGMANGTGGGNVIIGGRLGFTDDTVAGNATLTYFTSATSFALLINGTVIDPILSANSGLMGIASTGQKDIRDVVIAINNSNAGVTASAYNEVVAKNIGTGILTQEMLTITVRLLDSGSDLALSIGASTGMQDLVDKINQVGSTQTVQAKLNDQGKLVLFNTSGGSISVSDKSASGATKFDGRSGFSTVQNFNGMLRLESTNGGPISVETNYDANAHSRSDEAVALSQLGLVRTVAKRTLTGTDAKNDAYTVYGAGITASTTEWVKGEISLNGVDIWRDGQSTSTTAKKVDLINSFADQTGVTADRVSDDDGMLVIRLNSINNSPIAIDLGNITQSDIPGLGGFTTHGLREQNVGAADFDTNKPTISVGAGNSVAGLNVLTGTAASTAITTIDKAIATVDSERAKLGAYQNRLTSTVNNLTNVVTNTEASRSRIMDTDYSKETTALAKAQIVSQAATAMLAQANQMPQSVLSLLK